MRVFLPRVEMSAASTPSVTPAPPPSGHETVLLVEDEEFVRELVREFLRTSGYTVVEASCAEDALRMVEDGATPAIDLLVTDVVLPGLNGVRLAERLKARLPGLEALYISGYPGDAMFRGDVFDPGPAFLAKPFTRHVLTQKVREILNARSDASGAHRPSAAAR
jgi:CheY-like chemotaxis protein